MSDELTIDSITSTVGTPEALSDEQRTFLNDNAEHLTDEQATKYGIEKPAPIPEPPALPEVKPETPVKKEGEEDLDAEDEAKIAKILDKRLSSLTATQLNTQRQLDVDSFLAQNTATLPNVNRYRDAMLKFAVHPNYKNLTAKEIFNIVAGPELMRIGAKKEREAAARAKSTQTNNSSGRSPSGAKKDWNTASKEDFEAEKARVLGRRGN